MYRTALNVSLGVVMLLALGGCDSNRPTEDKPAVVTAPAPGTKAPKPEADGEVNYTVAMVPGPLAVGTPGVLTVKVKPSEGFKVNQEFPWSAAIKGGNGVVVPGEALAADKWKLSKKEGVLEVPVTLKEAGDQEVKGTLSFSVCNDDRCEVVRDHEVSWKIAAK